MNDEKLKILLRCFGRFSRVELQLDWGEESFLAEDGALHGWYPKVGDEEQVSIEWDDFFDVYTATWQCQGELLKRRQACALAWVKELQAEVVFPWVHGEDVRASVGSDEDEGDGKTQVRIFGPCLGVDRAPEFHRLAFDAIRFVAEQVLADEFPGA